MKQIKTYTIWISMFIASSCSHPNAHNNTNERKENREVATNNPKDDTFNQSARSTLITNTTAIQAIPQDSKRAANPDGWEMNEDLSEGDEMYLILNSGSDEIYYYSKIRYLVKPNNEPMITFSEISSFKNLTKDNFYKCIDQIENNFKRDQISTTISKVRISLVFFKNYSDASKKLRAEKKLRENQ